MKSDEFQFQMVCFIPITFCNSSWNFYHKEIIFDFVFCSLLYHIWRFLTILFHKIFICVLRFWPPKFGLFHFWRYSNILLLLDYPLGIAKIWARNIFQKVFTTWENLTFLFDRPSVRPATHKSNWRYERILIGKIKGNDN